MYCCLLAFSAHRLSHRKFLHSPGSSFCRLARTAGIHQPPHFMSSRYLIEPERVAEESVTLSVKLTMSHNPHNPDDHFTSGCFGVRSRRSPVVAGNNPNTAGNSTARRGGFFNLGHGGRAVLPPLHLPFRTSRSPGPSFRSHFRREHELDPSQTPAPDPGFLAYQYVPLQDVTSGRSEYNTGYAQAQWPSNTSQPGD